MWVVRNKSLEKILELRKTSIFTYNYTKTILTFSLITTFSPTIETKQPNKKLKINKSTHNVAIIKIEGKFLHFPSIYIII